MNELTRRQLVQVGTLGALGLTLPRLLAAESIATPREQKTPRSSTSRSRKWVAAKSCILFFMEGGPSHIDLWDMKPAAPAEVRGIYSPIVTSLPGFHVCDHLPMWAPLMHHFCVVRSVTHSVVDHNAGSYYAFTGKLPYRNGRLIVAPSAENAPGIGSVLAKLRPTGNLLPDFVQVPDEMSNNGYFLPGQRAGLLGDAYDPFIAGDPSLPDYEVPGLGARPEVSDLRIARRRKLLETFDSAGRGPIVEPRADQIGAYYERAYSLISSPQVRRAFDLSAEPDTVRRRYGLGFKTDREARQGGGLPSLGQSMLMARRLIEAGVRLVTVCSGRRYDQSFDTHRNHFNLLTKSLLPYTDRAFSALMEDLEQRGLLSETLVVVMGEFGRTPKLGQVTSGAGAAKQGRDHWPYCYTVFLAGAGIKPGLIYGASDRLAAFPAENPVSPAQIAATIFTAMGIDPSQRILDSFDRPHTICEAEPIAELFA